MKSDSYSITIRFRIPGVFWAWFLFASVTTAAPRPARIYLDPGHGGKDLGAQGFFGVSEKLFAVNAAKK